MRNISTPRKKETTPRGLSEDDYRDDDDDDNNDEPDK